MLHRFVLLGISFTLCLVAPAAAHTCRTFCGDANDDSVADTSDLTFLMNYFFRGGAAPIQCANIDGCGEVTTADLIRMDRYYRYGTPAFANCNDSTPCMTIPGGEVWLEGDLTEAYPESDSVSVPIYIKTIVGVRGLSLGFHASSSLAPITSIDFSGSQIATDFISSKCDSSGNVLIVASLAGQNPAVYSHALLCKLNIRLLRDFPPLPYLPDSSFVAPGGEWLFVTDQQPYLRPAFMRSACYDCGDANSDGALDISDIVFLIGFIFKGGEAPGFCNYRYGKGDANGDARVDISDPVYLLRCMFVECPPHCYGM